MSYNFNFSESGYTPSYDFDFGYTPPSPVVTYSILAGLSNNFIAIWADADAGLSDNKMYVASGGAFSVVDLSIHQTIDRYTKIIAGGAQETLLAEDIVDINVHP
jgi:hypothetical protein